MTLHPPVTGDNVQEILQKIRSGEIADPSAFNPKSSKSRGVKANVGGASMPRPPLFPLRHCPGGRVPESLSAVTMKALALKKEDRYPSVTELQKDIAAYQGGFATSAEHAGALKLIWLLIKRHKAVFIVSHTALLILLVAGIAFTVKIAASERRARATLAELQRTAPEYRDKALALLEQRRLDEALEKISYAVALVPEEAVYHNLKGNFLQSMLRLEEARESYSRALKHDPEHRLALENLELCKKLLKANPTGTEVLPSTVHELQKVMQRQQRYVESYALLERFATDKKQLHEIWLRKLQQAGFLEKGARLMQEASGMFTLGLPRRPITDLTPLQGMPLVFLDLTDTRVSDLTPLKGMPLGHLRLAGTQVTDLSPLRGMPLTYLNFGASRISDLSPLEGMRLTQLIAAKSQVGDLRPIKGMPLTILYLGGCPSVRDISAIEGMSLTALDLRGTNPTDFTCLQGMPLTFLDLGETPIRDLDVLKGMPLRELYLDGCKNLQDISGLREFKRLEKLSIPSQSTDIEFLRDLPELKQLGYDHRAKLQPVAEFWKEYDAKKRKEDGK